MAQQSFGFRPTSKVFETSCEVSPSGPVWDSPRLVEQHRLCLHASAGVLSYGYGVIEGMRATRAADGRILLFRLSDHAARFARSACRLLMPPAPIDQFERAVCAVVASNRDHIPSARDGYLYLRPLQFASGPMLGLCPAHQITMLVYASPVGSFHLPDQPTSRLLALDMPRSCAGGTGDAKAIGNYAGSLLHKEKAKREGFDDVLFTGSGRTVQETSGANVFFLFRDGILVTPALDGQVLPGITRDSVIQLARAAGTPVQERSVTMDEVMSEAIEVFCTGTAWSIRPIGEVVYGDRKGTFLRHDLADALRLRLAAIQCGDVQDAHGWTATVDASREQAYLAEGES